MRRIGLIMALAVLTTLTLAPVASAERNATRVRWTFEYDWDAPAGEGCDFAYAEHGGGWFNLITVGSTIEVGAGGRITVVHENLTAGTVLTETVSYTDVFFFEKDRWVQAGLLWHLRDADGRLVLVEAGLIVLDLDANVVKFTPNRTPDFWEVMCPALGGVPVS